ncbi:MAG: YdcF family protein [Ilumatobacteraceae bacterium]
MERDPLLISAPPAGVPATRTTDALGRPEAQPIAGGPLTQQLDRTPVGGVVIAPPPRRVGRERRRRRWPRRTLLTLLVVVVASVAWFGLNLYQVHSTGTSDQARTADAIVVMGAAQYNGRPSPQLAARLDHVVELWNDGDAPLVVVTGGKLPGDRFTEAEASARYLTERGVPAGAILEENQAHNSYDSLRGVRDLLSARWLRRVLLVSDPYHSLRIRLVSQELGMTAYVSPTRTSPLRGGKAFNKELEEAAGVSVGRIIGFRRLLSITG